MKTSGLFSALATLLVATQATATDSSVEVTAPSSQGLDIATRFIETVHHQKPHTFFSFLHTLSEYKLRPKTEFSASVFKPLGKGLDGKPRKNAYADKNPIFTRHAFANESYPALESSLARGLQFKNRLDFAALRLAVAGGVVDATVEEMYAVWEEREKEFEAAGAPVSKTECESWVDVGGVKVCSGEELWKAVGRVQAIERGALKIAGETPKTYSFDRYLPAERDESLPLVVFYAAPTDENFPLLFESLYALADPKFGKPRLQIALRWKPDTQVATGYAYPDFAVEAVVKSGIEIEQVKDVKDFSARAIAYIQQSKSNKDKLAALTSVATSLPLVASDVGATSPVESASSALGEQFLVNGVSFDPSTFSPVDLLSAFERDAKLFRDLVSISPKYSEEAAKEIFLNASVSFETPRSKAVSLAVPSVEKPLKFVNLAQAYKVTSPSFARSTFIEGVNESEGDIDPPAISTFHLVTDLNSEVGVALVKNALKFLENSGEVRLSFVHNPPTSDAPESHLYSLVNIIPALVASGDFSEIYPSELLAYLDFNASPSAPPRRSLNDEWTKDNPLSPFVNGGATAEQQENAVEFWQNAVTFAKNVDIAPGASAVLLNGRLIELDKHEFATGSFHALHQYELKRRVRPVVAAAEPHLPSQVQTDRRLQADFYAFATSIIASSGLKREILSENDVKGLASIVTGSSDRSVYTFTAVLDPLSPFARSAAPLLQQLSTIPLVQIRIYLIPSKVSSVDLSSLSGRIFRTRIKFEDRSEVKPAVSFGPRLPVGAVLDVKAFRHGEELAGSGGQGGETVKIEKEGVKTVTFVKAEIASAKEQKKEGHARDEL